MNSNPCISVIIANFNRADLLREAIQSVVDQSLQDIEIVIVDDGSEDHSLDVIDSFRRSHPENVRLFTHEKQSNMGIQKTHQLGISKANGEYVAFLDHDDRWSPNYLASNS